MDQGIDRGGWRPLGRAGHPLYPVLLPIPILCFTGAVLTDLAYLRTAAMLWVDASSWLLLAGLVGGGVAGVILIAELVRVRRRRGPSLTAHFVVLLSAWIVAVFDSFIHARDGWTAVAGTGITLSLVAAALALLAGWLWQSAGARRDGVAR